MGAPVWTEARATARWTFSMLGVTPGSSAAHFRKPARMSVPGTPFSMSSAKCSAIWSSERLAK